MMEIAKDNILFFDMDGTLIDTSLANYLSYMNAIQLVTQTNTEFPYNPNERLNRASLKKVVPNLLESEYERIVQHKEENYTHYLCHTILIRPVVDLLIKYHKTNKTVLVTNCREDRAMATLNYHSLYDKFSSSFFRKFSGSNDKINKFQNAITCLGISPELVIAFEDEDSEIDDAMAAGVKHINPFS